MALSLAEAGRLRRHRRIRKKLSGSSERPRLVVHRSHKHLYVQIVDDVRGRTILGCSTLQSSFREKSRKGGSVEAAKHLGQIVAQNAKAAGIGKVVLDRGGYRFHGRVKALTEAARAGGLEV